MKKTKRIISLLLAIMMLFTAAPSSVMAEGAEARGTLGAAAYNTSVPPDKVVDATSKFVDALSKFAGDTSNMGSFSSFLTRFGGVTSVAGGVVGVLQLSGVMKDSTTAKLDQILDTLSDMQTQLTNLDSKLSDIQSVLNGIATAQAEIKRSNDAGEMITNWNTFKTNYRNPLDKEMGQYEAKVNAGIKKWWEQKSHDGLYVLYKNEYRPYPDTGWESKYLTYSNAPVTGEVPAVSDNGETVDLTRSFGVTGDLLPDTSSIPFDVNTYRDIFIDQVSGNLTSAIMNRKNLIMNAKCLLRYHYVEELYDSSSEKSIAQRRAFVRELAEEILNVQIYRIACQVMSENDEWVAGVLSDYKHYCEHVLSNSTGIDARLNALYTTHAFEGEIKDEINDFCNQMIAEAGLYGQFALTCACQDTMQSTKNREELQAYYTNTILNLSDVKKKAITGHDNYCYITGTCLKHSVVNVESKMQMHYTTSDSYKGYSKEDWSVTIPNIVDNVYAGMLFKHYARMKNKDSTNTPASFKKYLHLYGVTNSDEFEGKYGPLMTRYGGAREFSLNEGIRMRAHKVIALSNYFVGGDYYNVDVGTGSKIEHKYYRIHDKVIYDYMDVNTGKIYVDQLAGARALYGESHWNWTVDECFWFEDERYTYWWRKESKDGKDRYENIRMAIGLNVIESLPVHDLNGEHDETDPFFAFDAPSLTPGVSDVIGPVIKDDTEHLSSLVLKNTTYTFTGKSIKPSVTVKTDKNEIVPKTGYTVEYLNNREIGSGMVVVKGKGKYSGEVCRSFTIRPKGTTVKKIKPGKTSAKVSWKKQTRKYSLTGKTKTSKRISGYQIRYSTKASMKGAKTKTIKGYKKTGKEVTGLKKKKTYYFQVRTYVKSSKGSIYSDWSKSRKVKIK